MISRSLLQKIYRPRPAWSRKGDHGKLLVVGGSYMYTGSPVFNALAAYRSGCDLVKIIAPEKAAFSMRSYMPDIIAHPVKTEIFGPGHAKLILDMQKTVDAMVIGGGLGRHPATMKFVRSVLKRTTIPAVFDADAIHAVSPKSRLGKNFIVTPHSHEFYVLSGKKITTNIEERKKASAQLASRLNCVVLLKGHIDVISDGKRIETNSTGNPNMTKGGFGDTLAGICGALLARGAAPFGAACAAAYINGRAGDLTAKKFGEGVIASDMINEIPNVIRVK